MITAQTPKYMVFVYDLCDSTLVKEHFYEIYNKNGAIYHPNYKSDTSITILPDTGIYTVRFYLLKDSIKVKIEQNDLIIDTICKRTINWLIGFNHRLDLTGFYQCGKKCDGIHIDYYCNGRKRSYGRYKNGKAKGEIKYFSRDGKLLEGRYYDRFGNIKRIKKYSPRSSGYVTAGYE